MSAQRFLPSLFRADDSCSVRRLHRPGGSPKGHLEFAAPDFSTFPHVDTSSAYNCNTLGGLGVGKLLGMGHAMTIRQWLKRHFNCKAGADAASAPADFERCSWCGKTYNTRDLQEVLNRPGFVGGSNS